MSRTQLITAVVLATCASGAAACKGSGTNVPEKQTMSAVQPRNDAVSVSGCLRAGLAENTFVLNATKASGDMESATYQLMGAQTDALRAHVGEQVQVIGMLKSEQQVASLGSTAATTTEGTSGKAAVKTQSEIAVKSLVVESVKPSGSKCAE